jgi:transcriptional regulator with XRE-family HTH domain
MSVPPLDAGRLLARVREEEGVTQARLAGRLGTTQSAIARLERAGTNPRLRSVERALAAMGRQLELSAPRLASLDEAQIRKHLRMTPTQRAAAHDSAYRNTRELVRSARRVS